MTSKKTGVIGWPVDHSLSPTIHNYWITKHSIDAAEYIKINIKPQDFEREIDFLITKEGISGLNVTVPLKERAFISSDQLSPVAKTIKAVNTLTVQDSKIIGDNTDALGFERSLSAETIEKNILHKNCLVLGAGGSSRAIIYALHKMEAKLHVFNRTEEKAIKACADLGVDAEILNLQDLPSVTSNIDLVVNTTSLGLEGEDNSLIDFSKAKDSMFVYDLIYNPKRTNFLNQAEARGLKSQNGMKMLIKQAAASFEIWHNILPDHSEELENILEEV